MSRPRLRFLRAAAILAAVACPLGVRAELPAAETPSGRSMMEMFKGVSVDRCKDVGGPPVAAPTGPSIAKLTASEGRPGTAVAVTAAAPDPARPDELHFLLKGRDIKADVTLGHASSMRAIVPDFGVKAPSKGWVYLVRGGAAGKALPFLFRERNSEPASVK